MVTSPQKYQPLGLPKGSVRALMAILVFGSVMVLMLLERKIQNSLWLVNYVILGYYFAGRQSHFSSGAQSTGSAPLRLPRGTIRWLIILSFFATAGYLCWSWLQTSQASASGQKPMWEKESFAPMLSLAGFFVGRIVHWCVQHVDPKDTVFLRRTQDLKAFFGLLCVIAIVVFAFFQGMSFPSKDNIQRVAFVYVVFYFGSR